MKRILALLLVLVMVLASCGAPAANNGTSSTDEPATTPTTEDPADDPATSEDGTAEAEEPTAEEYTGPRELTVASSGSLDTMDYVITARTNNH